MERARSEGRAYDVMRTASFITDYTKWAEGSVLVAFGDTKVLCNATVEERVPNWLRDTGRGWVTAEYEMLPRSTDTRSSRESRKGRVGGRTHEISRLIGRSLRAAVDLERLGERSITLDCDVIQADGGTRTASVTGAWVALTVALRRMRASGLLIEDPIVQPVAAVSVGIVEGQVLLDLDYREDQQAETDMNLVMTADGGLVEVQGTAEKKPYSRGELDKMLDLGHKGIQGLIRLQQQAVEEAG